MGQIRGEASEGGVLERVHYRPPDQCGEVCEVFFKQLSLEKRRLWRVLIAPPQYLQGGHQEDRVRLFTEPLVCAGRMSDNGHKSKQEFQTI